MLEALKIVAVMVGASLIGGTGIWFITEAIRSIPPSDEELERAEMRSMSWPSPE